MKIKSILPLMTCLIHGQMRPPLALSTKEKKGMFPRLKVKMEQLLQSSDLNAIEKWYMETLPQFTNLQIEDETNSAESEELIKLLEDTDPSFTPTTIPDTIPLMDIEVNVPNGFAELFYDVAIRLEVSRTWQWLKVEEGEIRNDESMLQVIRNVLTRLNEFSRECVLRQHDTDEVCNEIIKLRIMQLYFAVEHTYCKRDNWREYLEEVCNLPLTLDEYCYQLWEGCPDENWREAYNQLSFNNQEVETPNMPQFTERPKLTTAAEKFVKIVAPFCFEELKLVKDLNPKQQAELIESIVKDACYAAAMLKFLGYYDRLSDIYQMNSNEDIINHCAKAVGCAKSSYKKYFYSMRSEDPYNTYERHNSQAFLDNGQIDEDYKQIKESK